MTNKESIKLFDEFEQLLVKIVTAYIRFDHFAEYKVRFDTGEKVKEIYEIKITRVKSGADMQKGNKE